MLATPEILAGQARPSALASAAEPGPFQDIPGSIWAVFLTAWGLIFATFAMVFTVNPAATFVVTIAVSFAVMAFGLPSVMAAQSRCADFKCPKMRQTHTGPWSCAAAGTQIVAVPVCALIGLMAFITLAL
jgi:hypothetical protein